MKKSYIIGIFVLVVVVVLAIFMLSGTRGPSSSSSSSSSSSNSTSQQTQVSASNGVTDCGSMGSLKFSGTLDYQRDFDANAQNVWNCMTDALETCSQAKLNMGGSLYTIVRRDGNQCFVSGPSYDFNTPGSAAKMVTCGMSMKYISLGYAAVEKSNPGLNYVKGFKTLSVITSGGMSIPLPDGTTEVISCS